MGYLFHRLREPSTWAGVSGIAGGLALLLADPLNPNGWVGVISGLGAVLKREGAAG